MNGQKIQTNDEVSDINDKEERYDKRRGRN